MNTILVGSGTRCYAMTDSSGCVPWLHWAIFKNFLLQHIKGQSVIIGGENFHDQLFQDFLLGVCSKVTVVTTEELKKSPKLFLCNNSAIALASASESTSEVVIIGDNKLPGTLLEKASEIHFLQVDMNLPTSPSLSFPAINSELFHKVSWMDWKEEIWHVNCKFFGNKPRREVSPIMLQHWIKRIPRHT